MIPETVLAPVEPDHRSVLDDGRRVLALTAVLALVMALVGLARLNGSDARPGDPATYARLRATTDCAALAADLDVWFAEALALPAGDARRDELLHYADAADARARSLGCPRP